MVFFVIELKSRTVRDRRHSGSTHAEWMTQVARNLTDPVEGFLRGAKYLIHDRDPCVTDGFVAILKRRV